MKSTVFIPKKIYNNICKYLIPKKPKSEKVAFIFATVSRVNDAIQFQSLGYVELKDEMRPKIIKMAFDLDVSIIELHSHPYQIPASFSYSDFQGFDDFVPHVWWRLNGKPYVAMVFSPFDFDALVWIDSPKTPQQLTEIIVGKNHFFPNELSLTNRGREYEYWSF
mgnify:CR=1 FL=1